MKTVVTVHYLRRYNKVCGNRHCNHEFEMGETVHFAQSMGVMYCHDCYYVEERTKRRAPVGSQSYKVYVLRGYSGIVLPMSVVGIAGDIPPVYVSWVRDNKRTVAKCTGFEIVREERLVNP